MKKLHHENLVQLIEVLDDPEEDSLYMVMEMCKGGVIMKVGLDEKAEPFDEEKCRFWFRDLILAIEYCKELEAQRRLAPSPRLTRPKCMHRVSFTGTSSPKTCCCPTTKSSRSSTLACRKSSRSPTRCALQSRPARLPSSPRTLWLSRRRVRHRRRHLVNGRLVVLPQVRLHPLQPRRRFGHVRCHQVGRTKPPQRREPRFRRPDAQDPGQEPGNPHHHASTSGSYSI